MLNLLWFLLEQKANIFSGSFVIIRKVLQSLISAHDMTLPVN